MEYQGPGVGPAGRQGEHSTHLPLIILERRQERRYRMKKDKDDLSLVLADSETIQEEIRNVPNAHALFRCLIRLNRYIKYSFLRLRANHTTKLFHIMMFIIA